jgi:hypothetical protein
LNHAYVAQPGRLRRPDRGRSSDRSPRSQSGHLRLLGVPDARAHRVKLRCTLMITTSASTYSSVRRASSREPIRARSTNSAWTRQRCTLDRTEASMNSESVSPSPSSDSTSARNSGSTRTDRVVSVFIARSDSHLHCIRHRRRMASTLFTATPGPSSILRMASQS